MTRRHIFISKELSLADYLCRNIVAGDLFKSFTTDDVWVHCNRLSLLSNQSISNGYSKYHLKYFISSSDLFDLYLKSNEEVLYTWDGEDRVNFVYKLKRDKVTDIIGYDYNGSDDANKRFRKYLITRYNLKAEYEDFPTSVLRSLFLFFRESEYTIESYRI